MSSDVGIIEGDLSAPEALDALIRRAQEGDPAAFTAILERFETKAILIARSMGASRDDAEDIAQEAFLKIFRYIGSYRSDQTFKAYFYRIVMNAARDHLSKMRPAGTTTLEGMDEIPAEPDRRAAFEDVELLRSALSELPQREREVVILRDLQGLSTWEVARILRISPITVRRHSGRALAHLKKLLRPPADKT